MSGQEAEPQIVDCDLLEAVKENVQPIATGRRVTALSALLATPHAQRESKLAATRNRLRINIELALEDEEDGDPLEAYCALVYWTIENYPQGHSAESGLLELLEEATRILKDDRGGRWRGELKYLKLWLLYASYVEKAVMIYKFLVANDIGTEFALLYEEHAAVLERDGRKKEADAAYALGIARKAQPLDHLKLRYDEFQKRMMTTMSLPAPAAQPATTRAPRQALATTSSSATTSRPLDSGIRLGGARSDRPAVPNGRMEIFVDPTGDEGEAGEGSQWDDLGTRKTRIKENTKESKKMEGSTVKQAGKTRRLASATAGAATTSRIIPFKDPEPERPAPTASSSRTGALTTGVRKASGSSGGTTRTTKASSSAASSKPVFVPFVDTPEEKAVPASSSKIVPFRDEEPPKTTAVPKRVASSSSGTTRIIKTASSSKAGFVPFVDTPEDKPAPASSKIIPFCDEGSSALGSAPEKASSSSSALGASKSTKSSSSKAAFVPFVDTDDKPAATPAAPKFVPFRDETATAPSASTLPATDSVMKVKKAEAAEPVSEAEALRLNPLKNYEGFDFSEFDDA
ncbi:Mad3/BUB1 homology region 1-domain-containing protein [Panaeolus papilionaceus]|nr:Mad3/BUB1 homology region 1-domain-containing protein [Panaeolus papilionaceus]